MSTLKSSRWHQRFTVWLVVIGGCIGGATAQAAIGSTASVAKPASAAASRAGKTKMSAPGPLVDINRASRAQLKTLPGIGNAYADRIIGGRPYLTKADLVTNKALPAGVYLSIKGRIIARPDPQRPLPTAGKP